MNLAIAAGLASGALWGFAFVVPKIVTGYPSSLIAFGRFFFFGMASLAVLGFYAGKRKPLRLLTSKSAIKNALMFALMGNSLYYFCLVLGIRLAGITASSLLIGLLPVTVAIAGNRGKVTKKMVPSLAMITAGILLINVDLILKQKSDTRLLSETLFGVVFLFAALALWTWYAVANARFLKKNPQISGNLWSSMTGVFTLVFSPAITLIQLVHEGASPMAVVSDPTGFGSFLFWSAVLGIGASWMALWFWNIASSRLPTSLSGQLIVSETVFALLYGFIYEQRLPGVLEALSIAIMIFGVLTAIRSYRV